MRLNCLVYSAKLRHRFRPLFSSFIHFPFPGILFFLAFYSPFFLPFLLRFLHSLSASRSLVMPIFIPYRAKAKHKRLFVLYCSLDQSSVVHAVVQQRIFLHDALLCRLSRAPVPAVVVCC
jgi:hypothetical protein